MLIIGYNEFIIFLSNILFLNATKKNKWYKNTNYFMIYRTAYRTYLWNCSKKESWA